MSDELKVKVVWGVVAVGPTAFSKNKPVRVLTQALVVVKRRPHICSHFMEPQLRISDDLMCLAGYKRWLWVVFKCPVPLPLPQLIAVLIRSPEHSSSTAGRWRLGSAMGKVSHAAFIFLQGELKQ